jgi:hypothetical protein
MEALGVTVSPTFRTAVLVSANDAVALRDQLADMLRELQASSAERRPHSGAN